VRGIFTVKGPSPEEASAAMTDHDYDLGSGHRIKRYEDLIAKAMRDKEE
jgi:hypothetical protein